MIGQWVGRAFVIVALAAAVTAALMAAAEAKPRRIVSINLCADQLLLMLAGRENIVSLSYFATNPEISYMAEAAHGIPVNHGRSEEILLLRPDLVLTGPFTTRTTAALLRRSGCGSSGETNGEALSTRAHYVDAGDSLPRIQFADGQVSMNDRCMVRQVKLNLRMPPVYVNGRPLGFC